MDLSFKWRNTSGNMMSNSLGLNNVINDVYLHDQQKYESVDLSLSSNNSEVNHLVKFETQKRKKTATAKPPSEPKKINIFEKK
jgi:hypothetical protein